MQEITLFDAGDVDAVMEEDTWTLRGREAGQGDEVREESPYVDGQEDGLPDERLLTGAGNVADMQDQPCTDPVHDDDADADGVGTEKDVIEEDAH